MLSRISMSVNCSCGCKEYERKMRRRWREHGNASGRTGAEEGGGGGGGVVIFTSRGKIVAVGSERRGALASFSRGTEAAASGREGGCPQLTLRALGLWLWRVMLP